MSAAFDLEKASQSGPHFGLSSRPAAAGPLSTSEQIVEELAHEIVAGTLSPLKRIAEVEIAERFSVSRGPVREALRILESLGLVEIFPRRGAQVTALSVDELRTIYHIRAHLLGMAAAAIVDEGKPEQVAEIRQSADTLSRTASRPNTEAIYFRQAYAMTLRLAKLSGKPPIERLMRSLSLQSSRYAQRAFPDEAACQRSALNWKKLAGAIARRDAEIARSAAENIVLKSLRRIEKTLT